MKPNIHPQYYPNAKVTCACGTTFTTGSTLPEIKVEICSACHPFFTGQMKYVDTMGRVEKFQARQKAARTKQYVKKSQRKKQEKVDEGPQTLKEMFAQNKS
ncbi:MAG: 50S ribosomal protein L31 [Candidatus Beckwithbacteria bacterium]|nr:50S ribosomal protein L31 [Candidatus Beckwithbacteria bacterium]